MSAHAALPRLMDAKAIAAELGVTRSAALALMRQVPKVEPPELRKVYVYRDDVLELLKRSTRS